jgi:aminopeptidase N
MALADPEAIFRARLSLRAELGAGLAPSWASAYDRSSGGAYAWSAEARGARRLRSAILPYLLASGDTGAPSLALRQLREADNLTDREGALRALADTDFPERVEALETFHARHRGDPAALDKWFAALAGASREDTSDAAPRLVAHPDYDWSRAQRVWALAGTFAANHRAFHHGSGRNYRFIADIAAAIARIDPALAARLAAPLMPWRRYDSRRGALMKDQLERLAATPDLDPGFTARLEAALAT